MAMIFGKFENSNCHIESNSVELIIAQLKEDEIKCGKQTNRARAWNIEEELGGRPSGIELVNSLMASIPMMAPIILLKKERTKGVSAIEGGNRLYIFLAVSINKVPGVVIWSGQTDNMGNFKDYKDQMNCQSVQNFDDEWQEKFLQYLRKMAHLNKLNEAHFGSVVWFDNFPQKHMKMRDRVSEDKKKIIMADQQYRCKMCNKLFEPDKIPVEFHHDVTPFANMKKDSHKNLVALCSSPCHRSIKTESLGPDPRLRLGRITINYQAKKAANAIWNSKFKHDFMTLTGVSTENELKGFLFNGNGNKYKDPVFHRLMTYDEKQGFLKSSICVRKFDERRMSDHDRQILFELCNKNIDVASDDLLILKCQTCKNQFMIDALDDEDETRPMQLVLDLLEHNKIPPLRVRENDHSTKTNLEQVQEDEFEDIKPSKNLRVFMITFCAYKYHSKMEEFSKVYNLLAKGTTSAQLANRQHYLEQWESESYRDFKNKLNGFASVCCIKFKTPDHMVTYFLLYMRELVEKGEADFVTEALKENLPGWKNDKCIRLDPLWWESTEKWEKTQSKNLGIGRVLWKRVKYLQDLRNPVTRSDEYHKYLQPSPSLKKTTPPAEDEAPSTKRQCVAAGSV